ncbi:MAG: DUF6241 domain-containing protein [Bacillota bacterium]|nr:DUF6241 domain-containing protein [Bacillota bacterium]
MKERLKKNKYWILSTIILLGIGGYIGSLIYKNIAEYNVHQFVVKHPQQTKAKVHNFQNTKYNLGLNSFTPESDVLNIMNRMCHQKIKAEEKWGAVPMIPDTINQVYNIVEQSNFVDKLTLSSILDRWKAGDFQKIEWDHDKILDLQGGNVGFATGVMSKAEESEFILKNFGSKIE